MAVAGWLRSFIWALKLKFLVAHLLELSFFLWADSCWTLHFFIIYPSRTDTVNGHDGCSDESHRPRSEGISQLKQIGGSIWGKCHRNSDSLGASVVIWSSLISQRSTHPQRSRFGTCNLQQVDIEVLDCTYDPHFSINPGRDCLHAGDWPA